MRKADQSKTRSELYVMTSYANPLSVIRSNQPLLKHSLSKSPFRPFECMERGYIAFNLEPYYSVHIVAWTSGLSGLQRERGSY